MYRKKQSTHTYSGKIAQCLGDVKVEGKDCLTSDQKPFLIFDNGEKIDRILIFASEKGLQILSKSKYWHGDGTFHSASKYFAQLWCLFAYFPNKDFECDGIPHVRRTFPCVWALMKKRRAEDYDVVWSVLKQKAEEYKVRLEPESLMIDFELAAKKSFNKHFPGVLVRGCIPHFCCAIFK